MQERMLLYLETFDFIHSILDISLQIILCRYDRK